MNAPPGVDTDTSGEDFTPPPSPAPEQAKPAFSLTSFLPTKKTKNKIQIPATETPPTSARLQKKRVRIAEESETLPPALSEPDMGDSEVISVLKQLLANNTLAEPVEPVEPLPNLNPVSPKRPTGLDLSNLFKTKPKGKPAKPPIANATQPPDTQATPPWLWTVPAQGAPGPDNTENTDKISPALPPRGPPQGWNQHNPYYHPQYPLYPPIYPHPQSLQPWQPFYPHHQPTYPCDSSTVPSPDSLQNPWSTSPVNAAPQVQTTQAKSPTTVASLATSQRSDRGEPTIAKVEKVVQQLVPSKAPTDPTWADCLVSLATCIHLCESFRKAAKQTSEGSKHPFQKIIAKLLAGSLLQRNVVQDMQSLVGDTHNAEITRFSREVETINSFLRHRLEKRTHSASDGKRLSHMHGKASRALESGGLIQLLPQAFRFADMLTPAVLKAISDLMNDWLDHKLSVKGVMKSLMVIQHEVAQVQRLRETPDKDAGGPLMQALDILYRLFASDPQPTQGNTIPGEWPSTPVENVPQEPQAVEHKAKDKEKPHRSPKEVLFGFAHSKTQQPATTHVSRKKSQSSPRDNPLSGPAPAVPQTTPLRVPKRSATRPSTPLQSPQSSPSRYSESDSEGTVSSDDEARSLLAHADSGPKQFVQAQNRQSRQSPTKEQTERAKKVVA